jgi:hypothetical protein
MAIGIGWDGNWDEARTDRVEVRAELRVTQSEERDAEDEPRRSDVPEMRCDAMRYPVRTRSDGGAHCSHTIAAAQRQGNDCVHGWSCEAEADIRVYARSV